MIIVEEDCEEDSGSGYDGNPLKKRNLVFSSEKKCWKYKWQLDESTLENISPFASLSPCKNAEVRTSLLE